MGTGIDTIGLIMVVAALLGMLWFLVFGDSWPSNPQRVDERAT